MHRSEAKSQANEGWLIPARKRTLGLGGEVALNVLAKEVKATIYTASWFDLLSKSKTPQTVSEHYEPEFNLSIVNFQSQGSYVCYHVHQSQMTVFSY